MPGWCRGVDSVSRGLQRCSGGFKRVDDVDGLVFSGCSFVTLHVSIFGAALGYRVPGKACLYIFGIGD